MHEPGDIQAPPPREPGDDAAIVDAHDTGEPDRLRAAVDALRPLVALSEAGAAVDLAPLDAAIAALRADHDHERQRGSLRAAFDAALHSLASRDRAAALGALDVARALVVAAAPGLVLGARPLDAAELAAPLAPIDWTCKDLQLGPGRPNLFIGYSGSLKSLSILALALALAAERPIWGQFKAPRRRVLIMSRDSSRHAVIARLQRLAHGLGIDWGALEGWLRVIPHPAVPLTDPRALDLYCGAVDGWGLCIMDALRGFLPGVDESDSRIRDYVDRLTEVSDATGCALDVLHHEGKGGAPTGAKGGRGARPDDEAARGSAGIIDAAGVVHRIVREERKEWPEHEGRFAYAVRIAKEAEEPPGPRPEPFYLVPVDVAHGGDPRGALRIEYRTNEQIQGPPVKPGDALAAELARVLSYVREESAQGRGVTGAGVKLALHIGTARAGELLAELGRRGAIVNRSTVKNRPDWRIAPPSTPGE